MELYHYYLTCLHSLQMGHLKFYCLDANFFLRISGQTLPMYLCHILVLVIFMVQLTLENKRNIFLLKLREPLNERRSVTSLTIGILIHASAKISKLACIFSVKISSMVLGIIDDLPFLQEEITLHVQGKAFSI
jgi:hypothetical protein